MRMTLKSLQTVPFITRSEPLPISLMPSWWWVVFSCLTQLSADYKKDRLWTGRRKSFQDIYEWCRHSRQLCFSQLSFSRTSAAALNGASSQTKPTFVRNLGGEIFWWFTTGLGSRTSACRNLITVKANLCYTCFRSFSSFTCTTTHEKVWRRLSCWWCWRWSHDFSQHIWINWASSFSWVSRKFDTIWADHFQQVFQFHTQDIESSKRGRLFVPYSTAKVQWACHRDSTWLRSKDIQRKEVHKNWARDRLLRVSDTLRCKRSNHVGQLEVPSFVPGDLCGCCLNFVLSIRFLVHLGVTLGTKQ